MIPSPRTTSRHSGLSPAMLPSAHITCQRERGGREDEREREGGGREGEREKERGWREGGREGGREGERGWREEGKKERERRGRNVRCMYVRQARGV